jgi:hypothetical protein
MNTFAAELRELIDKYREFPGGMPIEDIIDELDVAAEALVAEINERAA